MVNTALIAFMVFAVVMLVAVLALSAIAWRQADNKQTDKAKQYNMWSAIVAGLCVLIVIGVLFFYVHTVKRDIAEGIANALTGAGAYARQYGYERVE